MRKQVENAQAIARHPEAVAEVEIGKPDRGVFKYGQPLENAS